MHAPVIFGAYTCTFLNFYESLLILGSPREYHDVNNNNITNVTSPQNTSATFSFKAVAYPSPQAVWYHRKQTGSFEMLNGGNIVINSSKDLQYNLTFKNVSQYDYGQYHLMLTNIFGEHQHNFNLNPTGKFCCDCVLLSRLFAGI